MTRPRARSTPRWLRRKDDRPAELTAAALQLFVERGYSATRLDDVAARANVSKGTLYLYFRNKEELFQAVVRKGLVETIEMGEALVAEFRGGTPELIVLLIRGWWDALVKSPFSGIPKLVIGESGNFPELARFYFEEVIQRGSRLMESVLRRGIEAGELQPFDPHYLTRVAIAPVVMAALWRHSFGPLELKSVAEPAYLETHLTALLQASRSTPGSSNAPRWRLPPPSEMSHPPRRPMTSLAWNAGVRAGALALTAVLVLAACGKETGRPEEVHPVRVTQAAVTDQRLHASYSGDVRPRYETELGFRVAGKILAREVEVGSAVKTGEVLARLDSQDLELNILSARSQLEAARSDYQQARGDLERYRNLLRKGFISRAEFDRRDNLYRVAKAKFAQAEAQLGVAQNQGTYATLRADADGVITAILAEAGQVVAAGQTVMRMARGEEREVMISVPENRLDELRAANDIRVTLWADPSVTYKGQVREVSPGADSVTRTYAAKVTILDADPRVQLGMTATVLLGSVRPAPAIELPLAALYRKDGDPAVWVVESGTATVRLVPVRLGEYHENTFTVLDGLKAGDLVVTAGVHKLLPGQKVKVPPQSQP